jgi:hypothetical protein
MDFMHFYCLKALYLGVPIRSFLVRNPDAGGNQNEVKWQVSVGRLGDGG